VQRASSHGSGGVRDSPQTTSTSKPNIGAFAQQREVSTVKEVSFKEMRFVQEFPKCRTANLIPTSRMKSNERYSCKCGNTVLVDPTNPSLAENQRVVYRRFRDYFTYEGRLSVSEYWINGFSVYLLIAICSAVVFGTLVAITESEVFRFLSNICISAIIHPMIVKRGHDLGFPGIISSIPICAGAFSSFFILILFGKNKLGYNMAECYFLNSILQPQFPGYSTQNKN
jgi:uncharacterized membrane protein YhaH (DUF805 family)